MPSSVDDAPFPDYNLTKGPTKPRKKIKGKKRTTLSTVNYETENESEQYAHQDETKDLL